MWISNQPVCDFGALIDVPKVFDKYLENFSTPGLYLYRWLAPVVDKLTDIMEKKKMKERMDVMIDQSISTFINNSQRLVAIYFSLELLIRGSTTVAYFFCYYERCIWYQKIEQIYLCYRGTRG